MENKFREGMFKCHELSNTKNGTWIKQIETIVADNTLNEMSAFYDWFHSFLRRTRNSYI